MPPIIEGLISFFIAVGVTVLLIRAGGIFSR